MIGWGSQAPAQAQNLADTLETIGSDIKVSAALHTFPALPHTRKQEQECAPLGKHSRFSITFSLHLLRPPQRTDACGCVSSGQVKIGLRESSPSWKAAKAVGFDEVLLDLPPLALALPPPPSLSCLRCEWLGMVRQTLSLTCVKQHHTHTHTSPCSVSRVRLSLPSVSSRSLSLPRLMADLVVACVAGQGNPRRAGRCNQGERPRHAPHL